MILSNSEPDEQILFSLYKTISKDSKDKLKLKNTNKENKTIEEKNIDLISNDPLSNVSNTPYGNNGTQSILIFNSDFDCMWYSSLIIRFIIFYKLAF